MPSSADLAVRIRSIHERIARAADAVRRNPADIRLIAISKTFPVEQVRAAAATGQVDFGENKVQEALQKVEATRDLALAWHLVGHLQTNKAKKAATAFAFIHSIDSLELLQKIDRAAGDGGVAPALLVQVDLAGEDTKFGVPPDAARDLVFAARDCRAARLVGLMTLPPAVDDPEQARPWFRQLRELRDRWIADGMPAGMLGELSMGMSHDFEVAVQEGATMVRVGTAIFGTRDVQPA